MVKRKRHRVKTVKDLSSLVPKKVKAKKSGRNALVDEREARRLEVDPKMTVAEINRETEEIERLAASELKVKKRGKVRTAEDCSVPEVGVLEGGWRAEKMKRKSQKQVKKGLGTSA
ncbi:hypothetical protein Pmar_PMAR026660 [Perkinsus marinus ATCC 50983]|uniref:Uncharacterized protein n=1 Tax=Perkinsus marinus (strain ATCC 50983 / TXsc) TaxID=423536 RepID=C5KE68_PERM5|nr:hypothetical protein Pmar_PMAR026660 [Perkinsus marinus ATCC 50983]EER17226.1 hypothetical protein Pmar_PMAR026660 [Perkinsus marinus ATCC 50983]|eukprot:XP_002785430.1 hypothetical protein Pmar_PMAR026660 [Perkinsus marinus ATCC 50983]